MNRNTLTALLWWHLTCQGLGASFWTRHEFMSSLPLFLSILPFQFCPHYNWDRSQTEDRLSLTNHSPFNTPLPALHQSCSGTLVICQSNKFHQNFLPRKGNLIKIMLTMISLRKQGSRLQILPATVWTAETGQERLKLVKFRSIFHQVMQALPSDKYIWKGDINWTTLCPNQLVLPMPQVKAPTWHKGFCSAFWIFTAWIWLLWTKTLAQHTAGWWVDPPGNVIALGSVSATPSLVLMWVLPHHCHSQSLDDVIIAVSFCWQISL